MVRDEHNREIWKENAKKGGNPKLRLSKFGYPKRQPKVNQNTEDENAIENTNEIEDRIKKFKCSCIAFNTTYPDSMILKFIEFWSELNKSG